MDTFLLHIIWTMVIFLYIFLMFYISEKIYNIPAVAFKFSARWWVRLYSSVVFRTSRIQLRGVWLSEDSCSEVGQMRGSFFFTRKTWVNLVWPILSLFTCGHFFFSSICDDRPWKDMVFLFRFIRCWIFSIRFPI